MEGSKGRKTPVPVPTKRAEIIVPEATGSPVGKVTSTKKTGREKKRKSDAGKEKGKEASGEEGRKGKKPKLAKKGNVERISEAEKRQLAETERAIFVAPKHRTRKSEVFETLGNFLVSRVPTAEQTIQSGHSYFVVVVPTAEAREKAIRGIKKKAFLVGEEKVELLVSVFGELRGERGTVWTFRSALTDSAESVREGLVTFFRESEKEPCGFEIRRQTRGKVLSNSWVVRFEDPVDWIAKQFTCDGVTRLLSQEGQNCLLCGQKGHSSWTCNQKKGIGLTGTLAKWEKEDQMVLEE